MSKFSHVMCMACWNYSLPAVAQGRGPVQLVWEIATREDCCFCGATTKAGIHVRRDPTDRHLLCGGIDHEKALEPTDEWMALILRDEIVQSAQRLAGDYGASHMIYPTATSHGESGLSTPEPFGMVIDGKIDLLEVVKEFRKRTGQ